MSRPPSLDRVAVALDTADEQTFRAWCSFFGPRVGALKVGLEAYLRFGRDGVATARRAADQLFLDLKLHDIPNTVAGAVRAVAALGADLLTVHAAGGTAMLTAARDAAGGRPTLLAVSVLTHLDRAALRELGLSDPDGLAGRWVDLAASAGLGGAVCSPHEVASLRAAHPRPFLLVTPGIRWQPAPGDDQRRVASPESALAAGSDLLVIGRPLTAAADPEAALEELAGRIGESL